MSQACKGAVVAEVGCGRGEERVWSGRRCLRLLIVYLRIISLVRIFQDQSLFEKEGGLWIRLGVPGEAIRWNWIYVKSGGVIEIVKGWVRHIAKTVLVGRFRRGGVVESVM